MQVRFADDLLAQCFREEGCAIERWGPEAGRKYVFVVNFLTCADAVGDLGRFALLDQRLTDGTPRPRRTVRLTDEWRVTLEVAEGAQALIVVEVVRCRD